MIIKRGERGYSLKNDIILFTTTNLLYSLMVFVLNLIFPLLLEKELFTQVVYVFQMIILMNSLSNLGISTGLLRNSIIDKKNTLRYALLAIMLIQMSILFLSFFNNNPITIFLSLADLNSLEHFLFYFSVVSINIYLYNKSIMNSEKKFRKMITNVSFIILLRILGLVLIYFFIDKTLTNFLIFIFILPFVFEYIYIFKKIINYSLRDFFSLDKRFLSFSLFCLRVFVAGALFAYADRMIIIKMKNYNADIASLFAFAFGFLGVVSVLNFSFQNYFLNRINPEDQESVFSFLIKIKKYFLHYIILTTLATFLVCGLIYILYDVIDFLIFPTTIILIFKTAITSYFGFKNILITSFDLINYSIIVNLLRVLLVFFTLLFIGQIHFLYVLLIVSLVMIFCELILNKIVDVNLKLKYD